MSVFHSIDECGVPIFINDVVSDDSFCDDEMGVLDIDITGWNFQDEVLTVVQSPKIFVFDGTERYFLVVRNLQHTFHAVLLPNLNNLVEKKSLDLYAMFQIRSNSFWNRSSVLLSDISILESVDMLNSSAEWAQKYPISLGRRPFFTNHTFSKNLTCA